jgi:hypothetical protein
MASVDKIIADATGEGSEFSASLSVALLLLQESMRDNLKNLNHQADLMMTTLFTQPEERDDALKSVEELEAER